MPPVPAPAARPPAQAVPPSLGPNLTEGTTDWLCINTMRALAMDAVQKANSGHPGTPVAMAPVAYTLWQRLLRFDPADPIWPDRDRFVLSMGHASMLLYTLLHLAEVKAVDKDYETPGNPTVTLDDIKKFRQLDSKCPGHPEYRWTSGIETTTGPLGQGVATSVGMAIAGKWMAAHFNRPGFDLFDFNVYALAGDGCMMEGISGEAASLAGHLKLDNLCWIYDNNHITIEGNTALAFSEDVACRFLGYGWNVLRVGDANDLEMLKRAFEIFQSTKGRPTLLIVDSHIAYGVPGKQDQHSAHGEPLGEEAIRGAKKFYGLDPDKHFDVPESVYKHFREGIGARGKALSSAWWAKIAEYKKQYPELADQLERMQKRQLPQGWDKGLPSFPWGEVDDPKNPGKKKQAAVSGRDASGKTLNVLAKNVPWLLGGAADLAPSTKTRLTFDGAGDFEAGSFGGRNFHFGIREHAMGAVMNGLAVSKVRPYGSGFLIFSDYGRAPIRLAAIMEVPVIYIFTHDSIGVGEDGPTHQPVEQLPSLRAIPNLVVLRPADANEVVEAWKFIMQSRHEPVALILTRQDVPTIDRSKYAPASGLQKGAYVLADAPGGKPDVLLLATGSEVPLCVGAYERLAAEGIKARVVSMPSWEIFEHQPAEYRESVIPAAVKARVAVEQASTFGWNQYVGTTGAIIGMKTFGASAPLKELQKKFGFTVEQVAAAAKMQLAKAK
ncbi:MAG TPA: transketolase [Gemmataceae bacterium]|nr:transketolase [Gemmataceae bacterium]